MNCIQSICLILLLLCSWIEADQIACPPGWISANGKFPGCKTCPLGTYQNKASRKVCKPCPSNTTTNDLASSSKDYCIPVDNTSNKTDNGKQPCEAGSYSTTGYAPCMPCMIGHYSVNTTTCKKCPSRRTTLSHGATHKKDCTKIKLLVPCPEGSISLSGYQPCSKCPIGYYQPYEGQHVCAQCPKGLSNEAEGAINCTNLTAVSEQQNNKTTFTVVNVKYQRLKGVKLIRLNKASGFFSSTNFPNNYPSGTMLQWKVHCFDSEYVGIIITHMDIATGDYLQVRENLYSGQLPRPKSQIIKRSSAGVIFSGQNGNSTAGNSTAVNSTVGNSTAGNGTAGNGTGFQCAFLCIEHHKRAWAEAILYNDNVMDILKGSNIAVEKAIDLILNPSSLITGFNDPYQRKILQHSL